MSLMKAYHVKYTAVTEDSRKYEGTLGHVFETKADAQLYADDKAQIAVALGNLFFGKPANSIDFYVVETEMCDCYAEGDCDGLCHDCLAEQLYQAEEVM